MLAALRVVKLVAVLVVVLAAGAACLYYGIGVREPVVYEIPRDYRGWVTIQYEDPTCLPLPREGIVYVIRLGPDGRTCASDESLQGWRRTTYVSVGPDGSRSEIPTGPHGSPNEIWGHYYATQAKQEHFFVGTEAELKSGAYPRPPVFPRGPDATRTPTPLPTPK